MKFFTSFFIIAVVLFAASCGASNEKKQPQQIAEEKKEQLLENQNNREDYEFIIQTVSKGLLEVQLGQLAQQKGLSPKVKEFGTNIVADHTSSIEALKELSTKKSITIPTSVNPKSQEVINLLARKQGQEFDVSFIEYLIFSNQENIKEYQKEALEGKDPETKAYAAGKVSIIQQHLDQATAIKNTIKN